MQTKIIELFGGPGIGKSSMAFDLCSRMKQKHYDVELVKEYAKNYAHANQKISDYDQLYILAKQMKSEVQLYGKVEYIVTDSPLLLNAFYSTLVYDNEDFGNAALSLIELSKKDKVERLPYFLNRIHPYQEKGRFQNEVEALAIDTGVYNYMKDWYTQFKQVNTVEDIMKDIENVSD